MEQMDFTITLATLRKQRDEGSIDEDEYKKQRDKVWEGKDRLEIQKMIEDQKTVQLERLLEQSELGRRFKDRRFANFKKDKTNEAVYEKCLSYAANFGGNKGEGLLFIGDVGTGKTHLAAAITNYIITTQRIPVKFGSVTSLLSEIKQTYDAESKETEPQVIKKLSNIELLVIDDLGKEKQSEWSNSIIYTIINNRYENYKPVIVTTNLSIEQLEKTVGEATVSRLIEMCDGIKMQGEDYRKSKLKKQEV